MDAANLRVLQRDALVVMLNLNDRQAAAAAGLLKAPNAGRRGAGEKLPADRELALAEPVWKVLVYDQRGQEIISPLLKVNELRDNGITVHMPLAQDRYAIPDVPAIYLVEPTAENIAAVAQDLQRGLYESYYINFTHGASRDVLEQLATAALQSGTYQQVSQVYDQYLNFVSCEARLFSSNIRDAYLTLNAAASADAEIGSVVSAAVNSLFSMLATAGAVPVIRAARGGAAEMVGRRLEQKLRDHLVNVQQHGTASPFDLDAAASRPMLVLLDRSVDLTSMVLHTWTYATLVHDVLNLRANRVVVPVEEEGRTARKVYDLDANDFFWQRNAASPFPAAAEDVDVQINTYKTDIERVTRSAQVSSLEELDPLNMTNNTQALKLALTQLPELTERKRTIDMHMNIATALLSAIQAHGLDRLFELEEQLVTRQSSKATSFAAILDVLRSTAAPAPAPEDRLRLFLVYYLTATLDAELPAGDWAQAEAALAQHGVDLAALRHVQQIRSLGRLTSAGGPAAAALAPGRTGSGRSGDGASAAGPIAQAADDDHLLTRFSSIGNKLSDHLKEGGLLTGVGGAYSSLISGLRTLMPSRKDLMITRVVEALVEGGAVCGGAPAPAGVTPPGTSSRSGARGVLGVEGDDYLYLDPRAPPSYGGRPGGRGGAGAAQAPPAGQSARHAIVYVVGGGNYHEYLNLQQLAAKLSGGGPAGATGGSDGAAVAASLLGSSGQRTITYGATDLVNPLGFLRQLSILGGGTGSLTTGGALGASR